MKKILLSIFVLSFIVPVFAFASFDTSLKYGSRGDAVIELQDFLQDQGVYSGKVDGRFGLGTRKSVIAFQLANSLTGDGYFGLASRTKANSILALELKPSTDAEQAETGTTTIISTVAGCTLTSAFSSTTGQPCNSATQPTNPNLPVGCTSTFGFSITTGQRCDGTAPRPVTDTGTQTQIASLTNQVTALTQQVQTQTQVQQQIQQNTQQIAQNTTPTLSASCSAIPAQIYSGQSAKFSSSITGGSGSYSYSWSGDCIGSGSSCTAIFSDSGNKQAKLNVTSSDGQTINTQCSTNVNSTGSASVVNGYSSYPPITIASGSTNAIIGKFYATVPGGEDVKVKSLSVLPIIGGSPTLLTEICTPNVDCSLSNVTIYFNGSQVGSSQNWNGSGSITFIFGSQMILPMGISKASSIEIRADLQNVSGSNYTGGKISTNLEVGANNAQGMGSGFNFNFPSAEITGTPITIKI